MKAIWGEFDARNRLQPGMTEEIWSLDGEVQSLDLVAMSVS